MLRTLINEQFTIPSKKIEGSVHFLKGPFVDKANAYEYMNKIDKLKKYLRSNYKKDWSFTFYEQVERVVEQYGKL